GQSGIQNGSNSAVLQEGNVYGSYIHGIFDENGIAQIIIEALCARRGIDFDENAVFDVHSYREAQYDKLAASVREALDMKLIYDILEEGI
ncbi:MAG: cobyric acid synthase CobQ, partial [Eubacteriales bacterium]